MTIEEAVFWYAAIFCVLLVPLVWMLLKRKAEKTKKAEDSSDQPARKRVDWKSLLAFRPQNVLSGEMWLKSLITAFVASCVGVIIVVFVFPLGAAWAAAAVFAAVIVIVGLIFTLLE